MVWYKIISNFFKFRCFFFNDFLWLDRGEHISWLVF